MPVMRMLPPVAVPAAVFFPALSSTALAVVLVVVTFSAIVKSPLSVSMRTSPVAVIPVGLTVPMVKALLFTKVKLLTPLAAKVLTLLLVWSKVTAPLKIANLSAVM